MHFRNNFSSRGYLDGIWLRVLSHFYVKLHLWTYSNVLTVSNKHLAPPLAPPKTYRLLTKQQNKHLRIIYSVILYKWAQRRPKSMRCVLRESSNKVLMQGTFHEPVSLGKLFKFYYSTCNSQFQLVFSNLRLKHMGNTPLVTSGTCFWW